MTPEKENELIKLAQDRLQLASSYLEDRKITESQIKSVSVEAEVPGFENKNPKFGDFTNKNFVAVMTDIRDSTSIVMSENGLVKMFKIFYVYSAIVANIVDSYKGTSTEFLGDGVLNLFDTDEGLDKSLKNSIAAAWDILYARDKVLNPLFTSRGLPEINYGIGISHGPTIVTRFGFKQDNDLKAFGKCAYDVAKVLCKGYNEIRVSHNSRVVWPSEEGGQLILNQQISPEGDTYYLAGKLSPSYAG